MGKTIKKYAAWTLSLVIMSFVMINSITVQAAPTYELKGYKQIKEHYEQLFRETRGFLPLDMGEYPGSESYSNRSSLLAGLVYMATYDKQWSDDTIHHQLQSLAAVVKKKINQFEYHLKFF